MKTVLIDPAHCRIRPSDINTNQHFWDALGNSETEVSANWIVSLCQERGSWQPFSEEEIEAFYSRSGKFRGFTFNNLLVEGWVVKGSDGKYRVTAEFVAACHKSSPAVPVPASSRP